MSEAPRSPETLTEADLASLEPRLLLDRWFPDTSGIRSKSLQLRVRQEACVNFCFEACFAKDELAGFMGPLPRLPFTERWIRGLVAGDAFGPKSRQNWGTWTSYFAGLWHCFERESTSIAVIQETAEKGQEHIDEKIKEATLAHLPEWFLAMWKFGHEKEFEITHHREGSKWIAWRSKIVALPMGSHKARSKSYSIVYWDEPAFQRLMRSSWAGVIPTMGGRGKKRGKLWATSTASRGSYWNRELLEPIKYKIARNVARFPDATVDASCGVKSVVPGTAEYRNRLGIWCFFMHYTADPEKDAAWVVRTASKYANGTFSADWLREYEGDDEAEDADRAYWAFSRDRNVVSGAMEIPTHWPIGIGVDFGQTAPTAIEFMAQDPQTKEIFFFDEIYQSKGIDDSIKLRIYQSIARVRGVDLSEVIANGANRYLTWSMGDPRGNAFVAFFARQPFPVGISTKLPDQSLELVEASEKHVNQGLFPSFRCCEALQYATHEHPEAETACAMCQKMNQPHPLIYALDGKCPKLVEQWEGLIRVMQTGEAESESTERNVKAPNHSADGARYIIRVIRWDLNKQSTYAAIRARIGLVSMSSENELTMLCLEREAEAARLEAHPRAKAKYWLRKRTAAPSAQAIRGLRVGGGTIGGRLSMGWRVG